MDSIEKRVDRNEQDIIKLIDYQREQDQKINDVIIKEGKRLATLEKNIITHIDLSNEKLSIRVFGAIEKIENKITVLESRLEVVEQAEMKKDHETVKKVKGAWIDKLINAIPSVAVGGLVAYLIYLIKQNQ